MKYVKKIGIGVAVAAIGGASAHVITNRSPQTISAEYTIHVTPQMVKPKLERAIEKVLKQDVNQGDNIARSEGGLLSFTTKATKDKRDSMAISAEYHKTTEGLGGTTVSLTVKSPTDEITEENLIRIIKEVENLWDHP